VEDMVNILRKTRDASRVGTRWAQRFLRRRPELKTRLNRAYDYQRALCEDPDIIQARFRLIANVVGKYGIRDEDIYNFDETGFALGKITASIVVTSAERRGKAKKSQQGNREWVTAIVAINAAGWAVPPFLVVAGQYHLSTWYQDDTIPKDWAIAVSPNGWKNNDIGMDFIRHFDKHISSRTTGVYRLLVLDGHDSHLSAEFELFCKEHNIVTLCILAHL
jgi:hypothetical protein